MLSLCKTQDQYLQTYGELLGVRAVEAVPPLYRAGIDEPLDLSFFAEADPDRTLYPCQENVVNALARAWQTREQTPERRARKTSKFLCGEMGTGKTPIGAAVVHATMLRLGRPDYRVVIMAPNHLLDKWEREIHMAVPGASVYRFEKSHPNGHDDSYEQVAAYIDACREPRRTFDPPGPVGKPEPCDVSTAIGPHVGPDGKLVDVPYSTATVASRKPGRVRHDRARWKKPDGPEWVIVGRNQAKQMPNWQGFGERRFADPNPTTFTIPAGEADLTDERGYKVRDAQGNVKKKKLRTRVTRCPKCGTPIPFSRDMLADEQATCPAKYLREKGTEDRAGGGGLDVINPLPGEFHDAPAGRTVKFNSRTYEIRRCDEPLWQWVPKPMKWSPASLFQKQGRGLFDLFVLDEMHEEKSASSGQAIAAGKIVRSARRRLGLTGTLIGGYAHHLFPLLFRFAPRSLVQEGYRWGQENLFSQTYGRIETTIVTTYGKSGGTGTRTGRRRGQSSLRKDEGDRSEDKDVKPGVMPTFFGRHLMDKSVFISLDEMSDDLPPLIDDDRSLIR
jgi:hypothetical protein